MSKPAPIASSTPKKKLTRKQQEEEDERLAREAAEAAAATLAAVPPSPFDRIEEIWALDGRVAEQRALVGQIFEVEDGPAICIQSLTLDDLYSHIHFARSVGLNNEQTRAFVEIMQQLKAQMAAPAATPDGDGSNSMEQTFLTFKQAVMSNAAVVRKPPPPAPTATAVAPAAAATGPMSSLPISGSRPPSATKTTPITSARSGAAGSSTTGSAAAPAAGSKSSVAPTPRASAAATAAAAAAAAAQAAEDAAAAEAAALAPPVPVIPPKAFSLENIRQITEYVTQGYFQHYRLYQAVFNQKLFRPRTNVVVERLLLETVIPDTYPSLDWAAEIGSARQQQQQQQEESKQKAAAEESKDQQQQQAAQQQQGWSDDSAAASARFVGGSAASSRPISARTDLDLDDPNDDISVLVRQHMLRARSQMIALIQDNEKALEAKLKAVEQRVGTASGNAAPMPATSPSAKASSTKKR